MVPTAGQLMHRFQAQPVFPIRLPKAHLAEQGSQKVRKRSPTLCPALPLPACTHLVVLPGGEEIDRAVLPPLDHRPASALQLLLTPH